MPIATEMGDAELPKEPMIEKKKIDFSGPSANAQLLEQMSQDAAMIKKRGGGMMDIQAIKDEIEVIKAKMKPLTARLTQLGIEAQLTESRQFIDTNVITAADVELSEGDDKPYFGHVGTFAEWLTDNSTKRFAEWNSRLAMPWSGGYRVAVRQPGRDGNGRVDSDSDPDFEEDRRRKPSIRFCGPRYAWPQIAAA